METGGQGGMTKTTAGWYRGRSTIRTHWLMTPKTRNHIQRDVPISDGNVIPDGNIPPRLSLYWQSAVLHAVFFLYANTFVANGTIDYVVLLGSWWSAHWQTVTEVWVIASHSGGYIFYMSFYIRPEIWPNSSKTISDHVQILNLLFIIMIQIARSDRYKIVP